MFWQVNCLYKDYRSEGEIFRYIVDIQRERQEDRQAYKEESGTYRQREKISLQ